MSAAPAACVRSVLVAGMGNVFLGDDGFGVEVARRLARRPMPPGVTVRDFGIRGFDLAYALDGYDAVVLVDAVPTQDGPGTLHLIEASSMDAGPVGAETHGMDPARVLAFARALGPVPERIYVLGCEPEVIPDASGDEVVVGLSPPVVAALDAAVEQVWNLVEQLQAAEMSTSSNSNRNGKPKSGRLWDIPMLAGIVALVALAVTVREIPALRRYMRMRSM